MFKSMKLLLIGITLVLMILLTAVVVFAESNPVDVPSSHWAYKAVKTLIDKGYLQLYQDQTFQGDKPVDRYTMAVIVTKILGEIASGQVSTNKDDMALLKSLTNEFRSELVGSNSKSNMIMDKLDTVLKEQKIMKEDITKTNDEFQQEAQQMLADIQNLKEQNTKLRADLERLRADLEESKKQQTIYMIVAIVLGLYGAAK